MVSDGATWAMHPLVSMMSALVLSTTAFIGSSAAEPAHVAHKPVPCRVNSCETATSASKFADSIGMNVSIENRRQFDKMVAVLSDLRIRHVRVGMYRDEDQRNFLKHIAQQGIGGTLITSFASTEADIQKQIAALGTRDHGGFIETVEGINEPNNAGMPWYISSWPRHTRTQQEVVWNAVKGNPETSNIAVIGPSVCCSFVDQQRQGALSHVVDYGNMHDYFGRQNPGALFYTGRAVIKEDMAVQKSISANKPIVSTETGWGSRTEDNAAGVDAETQAKYILRNYFEHQIHNVVRVFNYTLLDDEVSSRPYSSFGIVGLAPNGDLAPKPAYNVLRQLLREIADPLQKTPVTGLSYSLSGDTEQVHHLLLQKSDGSFYLALWVEAMSWSNVGRHPRLVPLHRVKLRFTTPLAEAELVSFSMSDKAARRQKSRIVDGSIDLDVEDSVQLAHLVPYDAPTMETLAEDTLASSMVESVNSRLCWSVVNASVDPGARIAQHACSFLENQRFVFKTDSIRDANSSNCLMESNSQGEKTLVTSSGCSPNIPNQAFLIRNVSAESFQIVSKASKLCVSVPGDSTGDGAQLVLSPCEAKPSQQWRIIRRRWNAD